MSIIPTKPSLLAEHRELLDELYGTKGVRGSWENAGKKLCDKLSSTLIPKRGRGGSPWGNLKHLWPFLQYHVYGERTSANRGFADQNDSQYKEVSNFACKLKLVILLNPSENRFAQAINEDMSKVLGESFDLLEYIAEQAEVFRRNKPEGSNNKVNLNTLDSELLDFLRDKACESFSEDDTKRWKRKGDEYFWFVGNSYNITPLALEHLQKKKIISGVRASMRAVVSKSKKRLAGGGQISLSGRTSGQKIWVMAPEKWRPADVPDSSDDFQRKTEDQERVTEDAGRPFPFFSSASIADLKQYILNLETEEKHASSRYKEVELDLKRTELNLKDIRKNLSIAQFALEQLQSDNG